jgi:hypothetical protein
MATSAQILANRENSLHSSGPVSIQGKAASARNSTRHGLTSKQIVLPGEDHAEFDALRESLFRLYTPANDTERTLAEEVAAGSWRLARARRQETAIIHKLIGDNVENPDVAFATLFIEKPKEIERVMRYITAIERSYYRALNKLEKLQKERRAAQPQPQPVSQPAIGFVSQKPITAAPERLSPRKLYAAAGSRRR